MIAPKQEIKARKLLFRLFEKKMDAVAGSRTPVTASLRD